MHISEDNINFLLIVAAFILNALVKKLRAVWNRSKLFSKSHINQDLKTQIEINIKLESIRAKLKASRVSIIDYDPRNNKAYMTFERTGEGIIEMINTFQGVQTSPIAPLLYTLEETGYAEMKGDYKNKEVLELHKGWGVFSTYKFKIYPDKSIAYGSLVISYATDVTLSDFDIAFVKNELYSIRNLINKK